MRATRIYDWMNEMKPIQAYAMEHEIPTKMKLGNA